MSVNFYIPEAYGIVPSELHHDNKEHKHHIIALCILRILKNPEIKNFWCCTNAKHFGYFKDLVVSLLTTSGHIYNYAIQVTYDQCDTKNLNPNSTSDLFSKHFDNIRDIKNSVTQEENSEIIQQFLRNTSSFVLHTNSGREDHLSSAAYKADNCKCKLDYVLNVPEGSIYIINDANLVENPCNFFLYTLQGDSVPLKEDIQRLIENIPSLSLDETCFRAVTEKVLLTVRNSSNGSFGVGIPITKDYMLNIIIGEILQPYTWNHKISESKSRCSRFCKSFVEKSKIVIEDDDTIREFLGNYINDVVTEYQESLGFEQNGVTLNDVYEFMWQHGKAPLVLCINNESLSLRLIQLLQTIDCSIKVLFLVQKELITNLSKIPAVCTSLKDFDVDIQIDALYSPINLQGRPTTLNQITETEITDLIPIKDVIHILLGKCNIGEQPKPIIQNHVDASFHRIWIKPEALEYLTNDLFIIKMDYLSINEMQNYLNKLQIRILHSDISSCQSITRLVESRIILVRNAFVPVEIRRTLQNKTIHYLKYTDVDGFEWRYTYGSNDNIAKYVIKKSDTHLKKSMVLKQLHATMGSEIRIISGPAGIGKSTLLDYIATKAYTKWWIKRIDLKKYSPIHDKIVPFANNSLHEIIFNYYLRKNRIMVLIDGFDELQDQHMQDVIQMIKLWSKLDYAIFLTTRPNYRQFLEQSFQTFSISLKMMNTQDLQSYLTQYITSRLNLSMSDVTKIVNRFLKVQNEYHLGIPLHVKMLTDFFTERYESVLNSDDFQLENVNLLSLCEYFVDKISNMIDASFNMSRNIHAEYEYCRFLVACKENCFMYGDISNMITSKTSEYLEIPEILKKDEVLTVEVDGSVSYIQRTFSEYIIARELANKRKQNRELTEKLFHPKFLTIRAMFDQILAKDCPLHLAIINLQLDVAEEILTKDKSAIFKLDSGGRSALHLIGCWGVSLQESSNESVRDLDVQGRTPFDYDIVNILSAVPSIPASTCDNLLNYSELDYAIASKSFSIADEFCAKIQKIAISNIIKPSLVKDLENFLKKSHLWLLKTVFTKHKLNFTSTSESTVSSQNGEYITDQNENRKTRLLYAVMTGSCFLAENVQLDLCDKHLMTPLHYSFLIDHRHKRAIIEMLMRQGADLSKQDKYGKTPLHYAIICGDHDIINYMEEHLSKLDNELEVMATIADLEKCTVLHYIASKGLTNIAEIFLTKNIKLTAKDCKERTPLHLASFYGHAKMVNLLVSCNKENINWLDKQKQTPLLLAVEKGYNSVVEILLDQGANVNTENQNGFTALCIASLRGNTKLVTALLNHDANIEHTTNRKLTPLLLAASKGHTDILKLLLIYNANASVFDDEGDNVLSIASKHGHVDTVQFLLSRDANHQRSLTSENSALFSAVRQGRTDIFKLLVSIGANINCEDGHGWTPLATAADSNCIDIVSHLLSNNTKIDTYETRTKMTPLMQAARQNNIEVVKMLLNAGALKDASHKPSYFTALHYATYEGHLEIIKILIESGADMRRENLKGTTPFILAIKRRRPYIVELFLNNGAASNLNSHYQHVVLWEAAKVGNTRVIEVLLNCGTILKGNKETSLISWAIENGQNSVVKLLLEKGANVDAVYRSETLLHVAATCGHLLLVRLLLLYGANINQQTRVGTPIFGAISVGHTQIVTLLLEKGASVDAVDSKNRTALSLAATSNYVDILKVLLDYNSSIACQLYDDLTPLLYAARSGKQLNVRVLLDNGAFINAKDRRKRTAIYHAAYGGHLETVKVLLEKKCQLKHRCDQGLTAIDVARLRNHLAVYELLLLKNSTSGHRNAGPVVQSVTPNWRNRNAENSTEPTRGSNTRRQHPRQKLNWRQGD